MKKFIKALAVAAPLAFSVNVAAATFNLNTIGAGFDSGTLNFTNVGGNTANTYASELQSFWDAANGGHWIDHVIFTLDASETVNISATESATQFFINSGPANYLPQGSSSGMPPSFSGILGAGTHQVDFKSSTGVFTANVNIAGSPVAAVPEPETYAMLLAGLGLIGFSARRRQA